LKIIEPSTGCITSKEYAQLEIETFEISEIKYEYKIYLDGNEYVAEWLQLPWKNRKLCKLNNLNNGTHTIKVIKSSILGNDVSESSFFIWGSGNYKYLNISASEIAAAIKKKFSYKDLDWNWGEGLFLEGLMRIEKNRHKPYEYVRLYHNYWSKKGIPTINKSDLCPPALSALGVEPSGTEAVYFVKDYIKNHTKNSIGALNHLGNSLLNNIYPQSIWIDSLMMYAVFAVKCGDKELFDFGLNQIEIFSQKLQDKKTNLWKHAWLETFDYVVPKSETYWLRGNGWALASIAEMLDLLPSNDKRYNTFINIFLDTLNSALKYQQENGLWDSIVNIPGYTFPETSGSALVAYSILKGINKGWLANKYIHIAKRILNAITSRIVFDLDRVDSIYLPDISCPTNAAPRFMYKIVGNVPNALYGVGIYLMACAEIDKLKNIDENILLNTDVIIVEELQFFEDAYENIINWCDIKGKIIICAGLDGDFLRNPFGDVLKLIPYANKVEKLSALCKKCGDGTPAHFSKRIIDDSNKKLVGSDDIYEAVCRKHFLE
jgi:unsaturated rhamnogalacturonyl hydrolase